MRAVLAGLALVSGVALPGRMAAQGVTGSAYGGYVNAPGTTAQSPVATLPADGGYALGEAETFGVPQAVDAQWLTAFSTGAVDGPVSSSQSVSEVENVSVLNGLISAANVTAVATTWRDPSGAVSSAAGSGFVNLVVGGVPVATDVPPNTRVSLPGVGYAVLNEQAEAAGGLTVNMIHVFLQGITGGVLNPLTGSLVGGTLATVGEIIVGSAASGTSP
jgi:hypothetical protein